MKSLPRGIAVPFFIFTFLSFACRAAELFPAAFPSASSPSPHSPTHTSPPTSDVPDEPSAPLLQLPQALYYLSGEAEGRVQVWRLAPDGVTQTQLTSETAGVSDFAVSSSGRRLAYISADQLYVINTDGTGRALLADGGPQIEGGLDYVVRSKVSRLAWSPDGNYLAYGQDGVKIFDVRRGTTRHPIKNRPDLPEKDLLTQGMFFYPHSWSPDGARLLVEVGFFDSTGFLVLDADTEEKIMFQSNEVCCHPVWSPGGDFVLVANPWLSLSDSGLWRFDVATGEGEVLIPTTSPENTLNFVGWPALMADGTLRYFYTSVAEFPLREPPLTLVQSTPENPRERTQLRRDSWVLFEALWSPDGSLVVAVEPYAAETAAFPEGPVILIDSAGAPVHPLLPAGFNLQWGP